MDGETARAMDNWRDRALTAETGLSTVMRVVNAWCIESNNVGGIDAGDLAWRLEEAGYPLPDEDTE